MSIGSSLGAFVDGFSAMDRGLSGNSQTSGSGASAEKSLPSFRPDDIKLGGGKPQAGKAGGMDPNEAYGIVKDEVIKQGLAGTIPKDGAKYGIKTGSADEWANFYTRLAYHESGLKNGTVGDADRFNGGSRGLFQLSYHDAPNYKLNGGKAFTPEQLADPRQNTAAAITIAKTLIDKHGGIGSGMGRYWGPISKEGWTPGKGRDARMSFGGGQAASSAPAASAPATTGAAGQDMPMPTPNPARGIPRAPVDSEPAQEAGGQAPQLWSVLQKIMNPVEA